MPSTPKPGPKQTNGRAGQARGWYLARNEAERYSISALIAAVIFFVIDVATGRGVVSAIGLGVIVGIVVLAISFLISRTIVTSTRKRS